MKILVIKSASMERLASLFRSLGKLGGPPEEIHVLAHPHFAQAIRQSFPAASVAEYPSRGDFDAREGRRLIAVGDLDARYDRVILLAGNLRGSGHLNVARMAILFNGAPEIYNIKGEFILVEKGAVRLMTAARIVLCPAVFFATIAALAIGGIILAGCSIRKTLAGEK